MLQRFRYFARSALKWARTQSILCPSCGGAESEFVERKYLVTELRKCRVCKLLFRHPADSAAENFQFYQQEYRQGFTSDCPSDDALRQLLRTGFANSDRDYSTYLAILGSLGMRPGAKVIEFGASWGYGAWQLTRAGYQATGYEISRPRARYAREKLGVQVVDSLSEVEGIADVFFSSHTLEHVPSIDHVISTARRWVKPGGFFIAFTPNGSEEFRSENPADFHRLWNRVHPNFLSGEFYQHIFEDKPLLLASSPYDSRRLAQWDKQSRIAFPLNGVELLCVTVL
jgi:2-polyprenyl-3-methyl-5-hydroxy-6-metoxy-1,4-benzoquinol methylase